MGRGRDVTALSPIKKTRGATYLRGGRGRHEPPQKEWNRRAFGQALEWANLDAGSVKGKPF